LSLTSYTIDRAFAVAPARLYRAFIDPKDLAAWVWGAQAKDVRAHVDARVGGTVEVTIAGAKDGDARMGYRGVFADVVPGRRLVYTVHWDADVGYNAPGMNPVDEVMVVEVSPDAAGSRLALSHLGIPEGHGAAAEHERSVRSTLDDLAALVARHP